MDKRLIAFVICCFFGITFAGPTVAYDPADDLSGDYQDLSDDPGFCLPDGQMLIDSKAVTVSEWNNWDTLTGLSGSNGLWTLANYIYYHFDWKRGAATTAEGVVKTGYGDCWGLTDFSKKVLEANGYQVKVLQVKTKESDRHRKLSVFLEDKNRWTEFDPSLCTEHYKYKPY